MKKLILLVFIPLAITLLVSCGEDKSAEEYLNIALEKYTQCNRTGSGQDYECDLKGLYSNISKALKVNPNFTQAYYIRYYIRYKFDGPSNEATEDLEKYIELLTKNKIFENDGNTVLANSQFTLESDVQMMPEEEIIIYALLELSKSGYKWAGFDGGINSDYWSDNIGAWDNREHIKSLGNSKSAYKEMINKGVDNFKKIREGYYSFYADDILKKLSLNYELFFQMAEEALKLENFNDKDKYRSVDDIIRFKGDKYEIHFVSHDSLSDYGSPGEMSKSIIPNRKISANQEYLPINVKGSLFNIRTKDILGKKPGDIIDTLDLGIWNNRSIIAKNKYRYGGDYAVIKINSIDEFEIRNISFPWKYDAAIELAKLYYDNCELNNAFNAIDKAIEINPDRYEAYSIKGDFYFPTFPRYANYNEKPDAYNTSATGCLEFNKSYGTSLAKKDIDWYENENNNKFFSKEKAFLNYAKAYEINPNFENIFNSRFSKPNIEGTYNKLNIVRDSISGQVKVSIKDFIYKETPEYNSCYSVGKNLIAQSGKIVTSHMQISDTRIVYTYMDRDTQIEGGLTYVFDDNCNVINILFEYAEKLTGATI